MSIDFMILRIGDEIAEYTNCDEVDLAEALTAIEPILQEQAETHASELRAYEATVANLEERIRQLEAERLSEHNAIELLRIFQRNLGSDREMCDEHEGELWDRIDATCKALAAAPQQKKEPRHE